MLIEPKEMVKYAFQLLQNASKEMEYRNIVNRSYYGAFLTARYIAGITDKSGRIHRKVANHYRIKNKPKISNDLDVLRKLRNTADYEPQEDIGMRDAEQSYRSAKRILDELEGLQASPKGVPF